VVTQWMATKPQEEQVCNWLEERKSSKDTRETAARLIQTVWKYNKYKGTDQAQNGYRKNKKARLTAEAKQARYMRDLRAMRLDRDWKLLHAFNPLYTDIDTLLGYAQVYFLPQQPQKSDNRGNRGFPLTIFLLFFTHARRRSNAFKTTVLLVFYYYF
jgi:hypothetical protein